MNSGSEKKYGDCNHVEGTFQIFPLKLCNVDNIRTSRFKTKLMQTLESLHFELHEFGFTLCRNSKSHVPDLKSFQKYGVDIGIIFIVLLGTWSQKL
jgi:hypothetical protein